MWCIFDAATNEKYTTSHLESSFMLNPNGQPGSIDLSKISSPDGRFLAIIEDRFIKIWDTVEEREVTQLPKDYPVNNLIFSPDGQWLAVDATVFGPFTVVARRRVQLWQIANKQKIDLLDELSTGGYFNNLAFSPDSKWLIAGGARVWEVSTGREVARLPYKDASQAVFSADGRWVATASNIDTEVFIWNWQPKDLIAQACNLLPRNLSKKEWQLYLGEEPYQTTCSNLPAPAE